MIPVVTYNENENSCSGYVDLMFEKYDLKIKYKTMYINNQYDNNFTCDIM